MRKRTTIGLVLAMVGVGLSWSIISASARGGNGRGSGPIVFVKSQGLYFDSIVTADPVPGNGPFQLLEMGGRGLETDLGPGDAGYRGGRWMEDFDGDGEFHYFLCPLLPPGRPQP